MRKADRRTGRTWRARWIPVVVVPLIAGACTGSDDLEHAGALPGRPSANPSQTVETAEPSVTVTPGVAVSDPVGTTTTPHRPAVDATTRAPRRPRRSSSTTTSPPASSLSAASLAGHDDRRRRPGWIRYVAPASSFPCGEHVAGDTGLTIPVARLELLSMCFTGFGNVPPPVLELVAPGGARAVLRGDPGPAGWSWELRPGAPGDPMTGLGAYRFAVRGVGVAAERVEASGRIVVRRATLPTQYVSYRLTPRGNVRPGVPVVVTVAGYRPGRRVLVSVYAAPPHSSTFRVVADLPGVTIDRYGEGTIRWTVPARTPARAYGISIEVTPEGPSPCLDDLCDVFQVGA